MKDLHGGDIWSKAKRAGLSPTEIIDFSASINPLGLSASARLAIENGTGLLSAYPEPYAAELTAELARYHKIPVLNILAANGSNELIYLIAQLLRPEKALIVEPAFSEYRRALEGVGCVVDGFMLEPSDDLRFNGEKFKEKIREGGYDICVVTNPTSHAGGLIAKSSMLEVIEECRGCGTLLVIDEAFCDFTESGSVKAEVAGRDGVIVLRSMTKFFAMAGLRLGYAISSEDIIERLASLRPTWSVNLLATLAGIASLKDTSYVEATRSWLKTERPFMEGLLRDTCGVRIFPGDANFFLCSLDASSTSVEALGSMLLSRGVLIRDMTEVRGLGSGYFRVALKSRADNELLAALLREFRGQASVRSSVV
ncbi:L-threonine 3-O-phosphate decarboxylase [hydrothermal vent metagenome]|uniref:threonine-phosphate decarboxylase n=1 Tax=hydrothermal vent metagenome TaxID=652676 RepID=A0A3B0QWS8_9ZZZZ